MLMLLLLLSMVLTSVIPAMGLRRSDDWASNGCGDLETVPMRFNNQQVIMITA
jgi:hypothetical protein